MSKHKKKKNKEKKHKHASGDAQYILSIVKSLGKEAGLKQLFPKVIKKISQSEIILALHELERTGQIQLGQKGKIKLLHQSKHNPSHSSKFVFGTADITKSGAAFVAVSGLERDVYIPNRRFWSSCIIYSVLFKWECCKYC